MFIPYSRHNIDDEDITAVTEVLKSDWITTGPKIKEFEDRFAEYVGAEYAVSCSSGTAGLHLATLAAELNEGYTLVTSPITFLASANCGKYVGTDVTFVDIDADTVCLNPKSLGKLPRDRKYCVVPVHFSGLPCNMPEIHQWARERGSIVIEDACHALGATYKHEGKEFRVGSCKHSDMSVFSFHPLKHIVTGEGGMVTTNSEELYKKLLVFRSHGMTRQPDSFRNRDLAFTGDEANPWYYEMQSLGFNYRMCDIQAALGLSQMGKLSSFLERRREIAKGYQESFRDCDAIRLLKVDPSANSAWHLFPLQIDFKRIGKTRAEVFGIYRKRGIGVQVHYIPLHYQPYYSGTVCYDSLSNAEGYYESAVSIPIFPSLTEEQQKEIVNVTLNEVIA